MRLRTSLSFLPLFLSSHPGLMSLQQITYFTYQAAKFDKSCKPHTVPDATEPCARRGVKEETGGRKGGISLPEHNMRFSHLFTLPNYQEFIYMRKLHI